MKPIRVAIADDEPLARERVRSMLEGRDRYAIVAECHDGVEAVAALAEHDIDLLFLDVQMPGLDGFQILESVGTTRLPIIVFVTAFNDYALRAFSVSALDYLLKPFDRERFQAALDRAKKALRSRSTGELQERVDALLKLLETTPSATAERRPSQRIVVKDAGRVMFVRPGEIDWVDAAGNYVRLHCGKDLHLLRETMAGMEARLDAEKFIRISRSIIVNLDRVKEIQPLYNGTYLFILQDGSKLESSRRYRNKLSALFESTA
jgi:two-component system LytT family response regulator